MVDHETMPRTPQAESQAACLTGLARNNHRGDHQATLTHAKKNTGPHKTEKTRTLTGRAPLQEGEYDG